MYKSREDYMLEMGKKNTYGTACEIRAVVRIYKCQVELYRSENAHPYEIYGNNPDLVIRLFSTVKWNGPHYDVCEPEDTQQTDTDEDELEEGFNNLQKETKNTNSQANSNTLSFTIQSGNSENDDNCESLYEYEDNLSFVSMEVHPEDNRRIENIKKSNKSQSKFSNNIINLKVEDRYIPHIKINIPRDGSCLFHSISYGIYGEREYLNYTQIVRKEVVRYIAGKWDKYQNFTCNQFGDPYSTKQEYVQEMLKHGTYGSLFEVKIAALLYKQHIEVYLNEHNVQPFGEKTNPLTRIYFSGENILSGHFDVCEPLNCDTNSNDTENEEGLNETNQLRNSKLSQAEISKNIINLMVEDKYVPHTRIIMPGDGNCLFNALSYKLYGKTKYLEYTQIIRNNVVEYISDNWDEFNYATCNENGNPYATKEEYATAMSKSGTFGSIIEIKIAALYYHRRIEVYWTQNQVYQFGKNTDPLIRIYFSGENPLFGHFDVCEPLNCDSSLSNEDCTIETNEVDLEKNKRGRPKKTKRGRPNLSGKSLNELRVDANRRYRLEKYRYLPVNSNTFTKFQSLLGQSLHRSTQEPYCAETSYKPLEHDKTIIINDGGKASLLYNFPQDSINIIEENKCCCNSNICLLTENKFKILKSRFMDMSNWCSKTILNFISENEESFDNNIVFFNSLKAHFPKMRTLVRQLYQMKANYKKIREIDSALDIVDEDKLLVFGNPENFQINKQVCLVDFDDITSDMNLPEDEIFKKYNNSFSDMTKKCLDTPKNECISCQKLFCLAQLRKLSALRKPIESNVWERLKRFIEEKKITSSNFICRLCLDYIRKNILPANCILNDLYVGEIPNELKKLNEYEKILIQRAKAFQMVTTMTPVSKRNIPNRHSIKKIIGRTFHLPLPLEATLQKLPKPEEPLNTNQDMYIIVRGCPTKKKIIWEDLVDVEKLYQALTFLKNNNQHNYEYEHYTIYPLHERRKNSSITALYQMLKVNASTLDHCDKEIDVKCFPDLYYEGKFGQFHPREKKITSAEFIKSRLMSCHSQFRHNYQYIFYLLNDANLRQLSSGIYYNLNITKKNEKLTKETYLDLLQKDELEGDLSALFSRLRNTEQFWRKPRNDVVCMSKYYGPPTWFLTVSPSEWNWCDLEQYLRDINSPEMANKRIGELIAKDPVSTCRFIDIKFRAFLDFLNSPEEPLGKIEHYFWRREYQSRGLQHFHILLWVKDAPVLEKSSTQEVADFISKYITCAIPNKTTSPTLYERVMNYQVHKHNSYCLRNKKRKHNQEIEEKTKPNKNKSDFFAICRFGFPRAVTDFIQINGVTEAVAARKTLSNKRLYNIQRKQESIYINDYNPVVMLAWNGNIDLQYIGEKTGLLNFYITKYTTKGEKSHIVDTFELLNSTKTLRSRLFNVGLRALSNRECGLLEASDTLLGISLYGTDPNTTIRWLDVNMNRNRRLKPKKQIEQLDPNSSDLFYESWVDDYYPNRPLELENIHLYDFLRWYDIKSNVPKLNENQHYYILLNNKFLIKRQRPYLINHYNIDINKYPENYYFSILLMFMPWRNLSQLKAGQKSYTEAFYLLKDKIKDGVIYGQQQKEYLDNWNKANEMIDAKISEIRNNINNDDHDDDNDIENPLEFQPVEAINAMDDFRRVVTISDDEMNKMIDNLNADQKRVFHKIQDTLNTENEILRFFVSGTGGTGKSYLINTIKHWLPPVRENSPFENISQKEIDKFLGSLTAFNLWRELFKYEELCINMRQQNDSNFMDMLGRIRLGVLTREDQELLSTRLLKFNSASIVDRLQELTVHYSLLSNKTVCLLPTKNMCTQLNEAMLKQIKEPEIELIAVDEIDCPKYFHKKVCAAIENYEDDSSMTAGLERKIIIKLGSRIMLRRNIDITLGLVNGSIEYDLERVKTKFEILPRSFVYREQFPICLAYAITIHKSQGLSLDSALLDIGSCIFSCGQAYVALSRVKNFSGVHLINFDPSQIKAQESAIMS
ncbi:uncharacterized protein LOC123303484 [Chrysoperla carnea]|uniref:uncharacterized protein LOC123303484 n=1 Tax=Chrysoperla carnea TaxID=189513 RepID=UPI001D0719E2|nr:uncharacterized protein LOC123303484 [Chrysoperla carnea]